MYGLAKGVKVKLFSDYTDGDVEDKLNKFFEENPSIEILDIKYLKSYHEDDGMYGTERGLLIYREPTKYEEPFQVF